MKAKGLTVLVIMVVMYALIVPAAATDTIPPWWSSPETDPEIINESDVVTFFTDWNDTVALSGHIFSTNQSGTWVNGSFTAFSATPDTAEQEVTITASAGTTVGWRFYANDTSDNWNVSNIQTFVVQSRETTPATPFMIYGWVNYSNGTSCLNPTVNINNTNTSNNWSADTNASYSYYQFMLVNGTDVNVSNILRFNVTDGTRYNTTNHTVTQENITDGGIFNFNITLESPVVPTITDWYNNKTKNNFTVLTINESECVLFNATADQAIDVWSWFINGINQLHNFNNFTYCGWAVNGTYYVEVNGTNANGTSDAINWTVTVNDITPPVPSNISANTTEAGEPVLFSAYWTDTVGLASYTFAWNDTGTWINGSIVTMTGTENWSNVTETLNITLKTIGWRIYANDTSGNLNDTGIRILTINDTTPPTVVAHTPTGTNEPVTTNITATFSEAVNESTLNSTTVIVKNSTSGTIAGDITYNFTTKTVTFDPISNLEYNETYNVTIMTGVRDLSGNNMSSNFTWNFTTVTAASSSPCFIATAAYGTPLHEDIDVLRDFRDKYLMTNPIGRTFVGIYYKTSPPIADVIRENEGLRTAVRSLFVTPIVYIADAVLT